MKFITLAELVEKRRSQKNTTQKISEESFLRTKREAQIEKAFPKGFRRYRVKNYEKADFTFRTGICAAGSEVFGMLCNPSENNA